MAMSETVARSETVTSPAGSWKGSLKTTIRHVVMPLIAGAVMAALEAAKSGTLDLPAMKSAAVTALLAGVIRWLQHFSTEQTVVVK